MAGGGGDGGQGLSKRPRKNQGPLHLEDTIPRQPSLFQACVSRCLKDPFPLSTK